MKQALISLIRTVVRARSEAIAPALPELTDAELRKVCGGALDYCGPKGTW
ncbi:MAG: hypothetical protein IPJ08_23985 [Burkholderiales bacterium]|nr:hypothetical protein [Burkholderiales bacterium]